MLFVVRNHLMTQECGTRECWSDSPLSGRHTHTAFKNGSRLWSNHEHSSLRRNCRFLLWNLCAMQTSNPVLGRRHGHPTFIIKRKRSSKCSFLKNPMEENLCFSAPRSTCLGSAELIKPRLSLSSRSQHTPRIHESQVIFQSRLRTQFKRAPWGLLGRAQKQVVRL